MNTVVLAADANTQPGWGKLVALLIAIGAFWVFVQVHKRVKAVREGKESNPFSQEGAEGGQDAETQVMAPSEGASESTQKGVRKWFRKG